MGADTLAHVLAYQLGRSLHFHVVVVESRFSSAGTVAANVAAQAPGDGYTLLIGSTDAVIIAPLLDPSLAQWTERDLCPLARVAETAHVLLVSREVRIDTLEQLVAAAHRQPGALSYGSLGGESTTSALGESFTHALQLDITHVPYRSSAAALRDLLGGHLSMMFGTVQATLPALRGGQLRALAVSSEQRIAQLPDVPTFAELGFAEFTSKWWYGLFTPCGLTRDVEGQLISAAREAIAHPDIAAALGMDGSTQPAMTGEDFGRFVQLERIRWMPIIASLSKADAAGWTH